MDHTESSLETLLNNAMEANHVRRFVIKNLTYVSKDSLIDWIMTEGNMSPKRFQLLMDHLDSARGLSNLGTEREFMPPDVNYTERGTYYQVVNPPDIEAVKEALSSFDFYTRAYNQRAYPEFYLYDSVIYEHVWNHMYVGIAQDSRMQLVKNIVNAVLDAGEWTYQPDRQLFTAYPKWTPTPTAKMDQEFDGDNSFSDSGFYDIVAQDAYGRSYYSKPDLFPQDFQEYVEQMAELYKYNHVQDRFIPKPIEMPDNIEDIGRQILSDDGNMVFSDHGYQVMPLQTIRDRLLDHGINLPTSKIKFQLMGSTGEWAKPLVINGFDLYTEEYWSDHFSFGTPNERFVCVQKQRMTEASLQHSHKASFAAGLPVTLVGFILNPASEELIYLNMVGPRNSVRANWAELMSKKQHYYEGEYFKVANAKNHKRFESELPSGLYQMILINHDASPTELTPLDSKFYLLTTERSDAMPNHFLATLDRFLKVPIMPHWAEYLWVLGRSIGMITYTGNPNKQIGGTSWTIKRGLSSTDWGTLISAGVASKDLVFSCS